MNKNLQILFTLILLILCIPVFAPGCKNSENPVYNYFKGAEIQCEGETQKQTVRQALNDILTLSEGQLKAKRYSDYEGKGEQWDLPTLITKHFVPDKKGKNLGDNFYHDIKSKEVQEEVKKLLNNFK